MARETPGRTLQTTALVHEAWLRLVGDGPPDFENRRHFFGSAARAMRRILIERARRRKRHKHGGEVERVPLEDVEMVIETQGVDLLALDEALSQLEEHDPGMAEVVLLRYFAGLDVSETAQAMDLSPRTVKRHWACARAWLYERLGGGEQT